MKTHKFGWALVALSALAMGCETSYDKEESSPLPGRAQLALDNMYDAPTDLSLLLVAEDGDWKAVADSLDTLGGTTAHVLPPRLIVGRVPAGADPALMDSGMATRFERAVQPGEIPRATEAEDRFARVFNNRYYPESVPEDERLRMGHLKVPEGEQWELPANQDAAKRAMDAMEKAASTASMEDDIASESWLYVPYASGTVVVSVWLPESNGVEEPSTEDWTEEQIATVYQKIQTALEAFTRHEPNSKLRFVLHYESAPSEEGLPGTIDHDWEFGKQANWGSGGDESRSVAALLGQVLGRDVDVGNSWQAHHEYLNGLRTTYNADAAFVVMVACNGNWTASLRAHAYLHGPSTVLHSMNDWSVFMHEFGHIFGAGDEYCPDACWLPTSTHGYLGAINANATYMDGGPGINNGRGESQPSLMTYNTVNALNGYTRSAIGWMDSSANGIIEVRDTYPRSDLEAITYRGGDVHLVGWIVDVPQSPLWKTPFSVNRITRLEYRFADVESSPWFSLELPGLQRGREKINVSLGALPFGAHTLEVRANNSVGNVEPTPKRLVAHGAKENTAPHVRLASTLSVGGSTTRFPLDISFLDLEGDDVTLSLDLNGDGVFETIATDPSRLSGLHTPALRPGRHVLRALATDAMGLSREAQLTVYVLDGNAPPVVQIAAPSSQLNGSSEASLHLEVSDMLDPEGEEVLYNWIVEVTGDPYNTELWETGFAPSKSLETVLRTPSRIITRQLDLSSSEQMDIFPERIRDIVMVSPNIAALALGKFGVAFFDLTDRKAPVFLSHLLLETTAYHLLAEGNRLFALGGQLAIIDITQPSAPREIPQWWSTSSRLVSHNTTPENMEPGAWGAHHYHYQARDEKIANVSVQIVIDHPDPSRLTMVLQSDKEVGVGSLVLMDQDPKAQHRRVFHFTTANAPELSRAIGAFTGGSWNISVYEQGVLVDKDDATAKGTLVSSRVSFDTRHRAIPVLPGASGIVGVLDGDYVVIAGHGLQVIDTFFAAWSGEASRLDGAPLAGAALVGRTVLGGALPKKPEKLEPSSDLSLFWPGSTTLSGLFALDLSSPYFPRLRRQEPTDVDEFALVGSRFYATVSGNDAPKGTPPTVVGDILSFVRGRDYELGRTHQIVRKGAFGDDSTLWTLDWSNRLTRLDTSDPRDIRVVETIDEPYMDQALRLGDREILGRNWSAIFTANLDERESTLSRVYQVTLEAQDASGSLTRTVRNFHVVPYAHAPSIDSIEVLSGRDDRDTWQILVRVADPDLGATWDPYSMVRADLDGDGVLESQWQWGSGDGEVNIWQQFEAGTHNLLFEARDGFYGRSELVSFTLEVPPYEDIPCGGELGDTCQPDEYCQKLGENACEKETMGLCQRRWQPCSKEEDMEAPVCGCNGVNYHRACDAYSEGVNVASLGECPVVPCTSNDNCDPENQLCLFETNYDDSNLSCGNAGPGECQPKPERCYILYKAEPESIFPPGRGVCGCDGRNYPNACEANKTGVSVLHLGFCEEL